MSELKLKNATIFAEQFLGATMAQGFSSLSKRDVDLLVFLLLEQDGSISRSASNFDVARQLRVTPGKIKSLRRDAYARWRPIVGDDRKVQIQRILSELLSEERISNGAKYDSEKTKKDGFLAVRIEHADDREELEQAIIEAGGLPIYERNTDVLMLRFDTLLAIADKFGFINRDPKRVRAALKTLAPSSEQVIDLLKKNVSDVTWEDVRSALNAAGADAISGVINTKVTALLRIALPFLS